MFNAIVNDLKKPLHWFFQVLLAGILLYWMAVNVIPVFGDSKEKAIETKPLFETMKLTKSDISCLTQNIYYEAANQPFLGKIAVGVVTINRTKDSRWAGSVCDVVKQANYVPTADDQKVKVCQFSWTCENVGAPRSKELWEESQRVARLLVEGGYERYAPMFQGAVFFHGTQIKPGWKHKKVAVINDHVFYK